MKRVTKIILLQYSQNLNIKLYTLKLELFFIDIKFLTCLTYNRILKYRFYIFRVNWASGNFPQILKIVSKKMFTFKKKSFLKFSDIQNWVWPCWGKVYFFKSTSSLALIILVLSKPKQIFTFYDYIYDKFFLLIKPLVIILFFLTKDLIILCNMLDVML